MSEIKFVVELNNIKSIKAISDEAIARALEQCGALWETAAKSLAPVDTGRLRNSIRHKPEGKDTEVVETNVEYAIYQEFGTSRSKGTPFIKPSGERLVGTFKNLIENELRR